MLELNSDAIIVVREELAEKLFRAAESLPSYDNRDYYDVVIQQDVFRKINERCYPEFQNLIDTIERKLAKPPYCVLVKGLQFDEQYRLLVSLNRALGVLVARPFDSKTARAQLIHHVEPRTDMVSRDIKDNFASNLNHTAEYCSTSEKLSEKLHIDGADRPDTVRFVSMQCVRQDPYGEGRSKLIDSNSFRRMLHDAGLSSESIKLLETQLLPRKIADYLGGGIRWQPILSGDKICWRRHSIELALRDKRVSLPREMKSLIEQIDLIVDKNKSHVIEFLMKAGDFLIVDNHRCLHARTPIKSPSTSRLMYRCWVD